MPPYDRYLAIPPYHLVWKRLERLIDENKTQRNTLHCMETENRCPKLLVFFDLPFVKHSLAKILQQVEKYQ